MAVATRRPMAGMPIHLLPRLCIVYELDAGPGGGPETTWRGSYFASADEAADLLTHLQRNPAVLQYEVYKLKYSPNGGLRGPRRRPADASGEVTPQGHTPVLP